MPAMTSIFEKVSSFAYECVRALRLAPGYITTEIVSALGAVPPASDKR